jgi:ankyrin repeat protein
MEASDLRAAAREGRTATVQALLARGSADPEPEAECSTALVAVASCGHVDIVRAFLADGRANPAACSSYALRLSALYGHTAVVEALLEDGRADPAVDRSRALRTASWKGHVRVVRALLGGGRADPEDVSYICMSYTCKRCPCTYPCSLIREAIRVAARWRRRRPWLLCAAAGTAPGK